MRQHGRTDDQMEFHLKYRHSFERLDACGDTRYQMPDAKTIWLYKECFKEHGIARKVFMKFSQQLEQAHLMARAGR